MCIRLCRSRVIALLLFLAPLPPLFSQEYNIAVAPFANLTGKPTYDYLGFQASEFLSSALSGVRGVRVVERGNLEGILKEQRLQLSGVTSESGAVTVGELLNAGQILVGSFTARQAAGSTRLTLNARIVDVENGTVITAAMAEAPRIDDPAEAFTELLYRLIAGLPGLSVTIGVEAAVDSLAEQDAAASADYARALAARFADDDAAASEFLRKALAADTVYYRDYAGVADSYLSAIGKIEGTSIYYRLMQGQIERNKTLMAQAEPLGLFRSTMKVAARRIEALLRTEAVKLSVESPEEIVLKDVSAVITLPRVRIDLSPEARAAIYAVFEGQEAVTLAPEGSLRTAAPPAGSLLSPLALEGLFDLSFGMSAAAVVKFLDKNGAELYRLNGNPVEFLAVSPGNRTWGASGGALFTPAYGRDGWSVTTDGTVQVQARELRSLAAVRVEIDPATITSRVDFPLREDRVWRSLLLHAYRSRYVKMTAENDPSPQIKDLVITDRFLRTKDAALGDIPVIREGTPLAGWADLWGVVYYGDERTTTVRGLWSGSINGESKPVSGSLTSSSVLYFRNPGRDELLSQAVTFTVRADGAERSLTMPVSSGSSWKSSLGRTWDESAGVVFSYYGQPRAITVTTGRQLWESASRLSDSRPAGGVSGSSVYCFDGFTIVKLDRRTGSETLRKEVHQRSYSGGNATRGVDILALPDAIYATCYYDNGSYGQLFRLDPGTLETIWQSDMGPGTLLSVSGNLYLGYESAMDRIDPGTGAVIGGQLPLGSAVFSGNGVFGTDGRKISRYDTNFSASVWSAPVPAKAVALRGDVLYATGRKTWALSASDGRILWEMEVPGKYMVTSRNGVLVGNGSTLTSLHPETGYVQWTSPLEKEGISLSGSYLLHSGGCVDLSVMYEE